MKKINKSKLVLYKMEFLPLYNKSLAPRTEYVKSRLSQKNLQTSFERFCMMPGTEYYGYVKVEINVAKDVPEMMQIGIQNSKMLSRREVDKRRKKFKNQKDIIKATSPKALRQRLLKLRKRSTKILKRI